ncbi:vegetative cell wall protein gp1-like [Lutra lutra]|uniref:vegetative cell wall protein gp1-like n=1 Tax=Lutra lutra TaxID=9657 RepID=UPI001FD0C22A|nr:vegetative cell wall protein gp1-like [Lutra lutra]
MTASGFASGGSVRLSSRVRRGAEPSAIGSISLTRGDLVGSTATAGAARPTPTDRLAAGPHPAPLRAPARSTPHSSPFRFSAPSIGLEGSGLSARVSAGALRTASPQPRLSAQTIRDDVAFRRKPADLPVFMPAPSPPTNPSAPPPSPVSAPPHLQAPASPSFAPHCPPDLCPAPPRPSYPHKLTPRSPHLPVLREALGPGPQPSAPPGPRAREPRGRRAQVDARAWRGDELAHPSPPAPPPAPPIGSPRAGRAPVGSRRAAAGPVSRWVAPQRGCCSVPPRPPGARSRSGRAGPGGGHRREPLLRPPRPAAEGSPGSRPHRAAAGGGQRAMRGRELRRGARGSRGPQRRR